MPISILCVQWEKSSRIKYTKYPILSYTSIFKKKVLYRYSSLIGQKWNLQGSPKETLQRAKTMRAELLIQTNKEADY